MPTVAESLRILGLEANATVQEIQSAYRRQALKFHPDRNPDGEEAFKALASARDTLIEEKSKKQNTQPEDERPRQARNQPGNAVNIISYTRYYPRLRPRHERTSRRDIFTMVEFFGKIWESTLPLPRRLEATVFLMYSTRSIYIRFPISQRSFQFGVVSSYQFITYEGKNVCQISRADGHCFIFEHEHLQSFIRRLL